MKEEKKTEVKVDLSRLQENIDLWKQMTEDNCHSEVCYYIAEFFHLGKWTRNFFWYTQLEYLTTDLSVKRQNELNQMLGEIEVEYGEEIVKRINEAL